MRVNRAARDQVCADSPKIEQLVWSPADAGKVAQHFSAGLAFFRSGDCALAPHVWSLSTMPLNSKSDGLLAI